MIFRRINLPKFVQFKDYKANQEWTAPYSFAKTLVKINPPQEKIAHGALAPSADRDRRPCTFCTPLVETREAVSVLPQRIRRIRDE